MKIDIPFSEFFLENMTLTRGTPPCTPHMEVPPWVHLNLKINDIKVPETLGDDRPLRSILARRSQSMHAKAYGSVLFSASNLNLFMGFCRKDIWIRTD